VSPLPSGGLLPGPTVLPGNGTPEGDGFYAHSFEDLTPPAAFDDIAFVSVEIEQATIEAPTVWTLIDTIAITEDPSPETPDANDITTRKATVPAGWFRFRFLDEDDVATAWTVPTLSPATIYDWAPTLPRIAAIQRSRTRGTASRDAGIAGEQGTFTATTRPTADAVRSLIAVACADLLAVTEGIEPCTAALDFAAGNAVAYRVAMLIELSYLPEQTNGDMTAYKAFKDLWEETSARVGGRILEQCPIPGTPGGEDTSSRDGMPVGNVPSRFLIGPSQVPW
jgi:hypothetical protein